jgi:hypothetical protein
MIGARSPRGQEDSKVMLTDAAITDALNQTVQKIREGDLEQAQASLAVLEFHQLMRPMKDSVKGPRQFFDPAREFGPERVHETGDHISRCIAALGLGDGENALAEAEAAAARWGKEGGEVLVPKIQT